jgi:prepilin-type N-terminal cleavage/methylation domain-containing protein
MKNRPSALSPRQGFTLIEVLVVIAIISLLMGMIFPSVATALNSAKKRRAANDAKQIAAAVEIFLKQYGYLPVPRTEQGFRAGPGNGDFGQEQVQPFTEDESKKIIQVLRSTPQNYNQNHQLNPKRVVFYDTEGAEEDGTVLDPWGNQYRIKLDRDFNGKVEYYSDPIQYRTSVVVVSAGPEGWNNDTPVEAEDLIANVELEID